MRHPGVFGHASKPVLNAGPGLAAILGYVNPAVVGADPDHAFLDRTWRNGNDRGEVFGRRDVRRQTARLLVDLPVRIVARQIVRNGRPGIAAVGRFVNKLAAVIDCRRIERILGDPRIPVKAQLDPRLWRGRADHFAFTVAQVPAEQEAALAHGVTAHRIFGIRKGIEAVTETDFLPVDAADSA